MPATNSLRIDTELKALIPALTNEEEARLEQSLVNDGCRDKLVVWTNDPENPHGQTLIDGFNRYDLCDRNSVPFEVRGMEHPDRDAVKLWMIENQLGRRNLNDFQQAELALKLKPLLAADAERRERAGKKADPGQDSAQGRTADAIARAAGVSHDTIKKVEQIQKNAVPEVVGLARAGDVSVAAAAAVSKLPPAVQKRVAKKGPAAVKAKAAQIRNTGVAAAAKSTTTPGFKSDAPTDQIGHPIQDPDLQQVFAQRPAFESLKRSISALKGEFESLMDGAAGAWAERHRQEFEAQASALHGTVRFVTPYALCPYCGGQKCDGCKQTGWLPEDVYKRVPEDIKGSFTAA